MKSIVFQINKRYLSIEDKTDMWNIKKFQPKDIFDASDFIIERLAIMFDNERKLQKSIWINLFLF